MKEKEPDIFDRLMHLPGLRVFESFYKAHKDKLLYLLFGGLTTVVSIGLYTLCVYGCSMAVLGANIISWIGAVLFAYVTNRKWVFASKADSKKLFLKEMAAFFGGRLFSLGIEELVLLIFIVWLGLSPFAVKIAAQMIVLVLNYVISKFMVFK